MVETIIKIIEAVGAALGIVGVIVGLIGGKIWWEARKAKTASQLDEVELAKRKEIAPLEAGVEKVGAFGQVITAFEKMSVDLSKFMALAAEVPELKERLSAVEKKEEDCLERENQKAIEIERLRRDKYLLRNDVFKLEAEMRAVQMKQSETSRERDVRVTMERTQDIVSVPPRVGIDTGSE